MGYHPTSKCADALYIAKHLCIVLDTARTGIGAVVEAVASQPWPAGKQLKVHSKAGSLSYSTRRTKGVPGAALVKSCKDMYVMRIGKVYLRLFTFVNRCFPGSSLAASEQHAAVNTLPNNIRG